VSKKKEGDEGKGKKGMAIYAVLLIVGVFVGKTFLGGGGASAATSGAAATTTTVKGTVVTLGDTTVNLSDGHLLKVGIALQLTGESELGTVAEGAPKPDANDPTKGWAEAMNIAIGVFGDQTYAQLIAPGGRETARQLLAAKLKVAYPEDIDDLYLYEFVMQ
jgi:flagellar FliL protein